jgi:Zn-dependent protease
VSVFLIVFIGWIVSVCIHEFGHASVAYLGGDKSVKHKGYLSNPFKYIHPVNTVIMPLVFLVIGRIGLPGAAVRINEAALRSRAWRVAVSLAGPLMNVLQAVVLSAPFMLGWWSPEERGTLVVSVAVLAQLQVCAVILNMLPVPPLDGFQALSALVLPRGLRKMLLRASTIVMLVLFFVVFRQPHVGRRGASWDIHEQSPVK